MEAEMISVSLLSLRGLEDGIDEPIRETRRR